MRTPSLPRLVAACAALTLACSSGGGARGGPGGGGDGDAQPGPMTAAHRTSGVAPLAVFFDAIDTVPAGTASPFTWQSGIHQPGDPEGAQYVWDFGDPGAGAWSTTGNARNAATGYAAAHVYETPGTYVVRLTQTDVDGAVRTYAQTITVSAFGGTTYYVAADGSDAADGTSTAAPFQSVDRAMTAALQAAGPVQVLFRRGDTFAVTASYAITKEGPGLVGAYGSGARPVLNVAELGDVNAFSVRGAGVDWRFVDLDLVGPGPATTTGPIGPTVTEQAVNTLILRVKARSWAVGIGWGDWTPIYATPHDGMFVVESEVPPSGNCSLYVGGRRIALLGNLAYDGLATHIARVWQAHKGVISNNAFLRPGGQRHALKLHGPELGDGRPETRWVTISDNLFQASATSQWTVSMGSQSGAATEADPVSHVVVERNRFTGSPSLVVDLESEAAHVMVRNNVFDDSLGHGTTAVLYAQRNTALPAPDDVRVYANTVYGTSLDATAFSVGAEVTRCRVRDNLFGVADGTGTTLIAGGGGAGWAADHNLMTAAPGFADAAAGDFSLAAGSPAIDAGVTLPEVAGDIMGTARPLGAAPDLGAYESR